MEAQHPPEGADAAFGRRLRYLREEAGLTQQQLADVMRETGAKMHRSTIGKIEAGERVMSIGEGAQFADVLGVNLTELITVRNSRLVPAQLKVRSLEYRAAEYARQRDEAQVLLDDTLAKLEDARGRLKELEVEQ
jgi:transcriptional regulator with XRE-family HTH domain